MWWILGIVWVMIALMAWSACAAAGRADDQAGHPRG